MNIFISILMALNFFSPSKEADVSVSLICPPDVWISCGAEIWNLSIYGNAYYYINGNQYLANNPTVVYDLTTCQTGKIYRTWQVEDYNWNIIECTQTIYINGGYFNYGNIDWPDTDLHLYGCNVSTHPDNLPEGYGRPSFDYMTCSMVGSSYKDQVFYFGQDCKKILRKWTVLDWCNYYPGSNNGGIWTYTQVIKVSNTETPILSCEKEKIVIPSDCYGAYVALSPVEVEGQSCTGSYTITNNSPYADLKYENASGFYPIGKTIVEYSVEYACGALVKCHTEIRVKEKPPVPYCLSSLNVALMPVDSDADGLTDEGMVEVWAKDLDYASYHPCNTLPLKFSFSSNVDSTFRIFTCKDVGYNDLQLWVTDVNGNQAWCAVTIWVQNNAANIPNCEVIDIGNRELSGNTIDQFSEPLSNVYVDLKSKAYQGKKVVEETVLEEVIIDSTYTQGGLLIYFYDIIEKTTLVEQDVLIPGVTINLISDENGSFSATDIDPDRRYVMSAFKIGDNSKIDQSDLNILTEYVSGEREFKSMYSHIAADINEDRRVDEEDVRLLEQILSGEEDEWPNERQWIFYDAKGFENIEGNPLHNEISQKIYLDKDLSRFSEHNFLGIMKGDLDGYESVNNEKIQLVNRNNSKTNEDVYPNPFMDMIFIQNQQNKNLEIKIFNLDGKLLFNKKSSNSRVEVSESESWNSGTYYYLIYDGEETKTGKIIKI